jgi:hypothetical protein
MKIKFLPLLLVMIATSAMAADKYLSSDFGFAAAFPADVVQTQVTSDVSTFVAGAPGGGWVAQIKAFKNVTMPQDVGKKFMETKLAEVLSDGGMTQTGNSSYTQFHHYPALFTTATFFVNNANTSYLSRRVAVDMELIFVPAQNRFYFVAGWAVQGLDRSAIQPFINSFELR